MNRSISLIATLFLLGLTAPAIYGKAQLELTDPGLAVQELRPLERRVYVLTFEGTWDKPANAKTVYYVNALFANGRATSHKVDDVEMFRKGEVRCTIQSHELARGGVEKGGTISICVSAGRPVKAPDAPEVVSSVLKIKWPLKRQVTPFRPRSKFSEPEPVDGFTIPGSPTPPRKSASESKTP